jgi:2-methylaconitate cis-trans-isomerase PrpF
MAFSATASTAEPRSFSIGPKKVQIFNWGAASGDTSGTITADALNNAEQVIVGGGLTQSAVPTYSGNVVTLTFVDPAATVKGQLMVIGT